MLFRQQQIIDHFWNIAALFIIWVFSSMHTVYTVSAFGVGVGGVGMELTPWGNTGTTPWGRAKTVEFNPHNPHDNSSSSRNVE